MLYHWCVHNPMCRHWKQGRVYKRVEVGLNGIQSEDKYLEQHIESEDFFS